jgi:hypothetical protein
MVAVVGRHGAEAVRGQELGFVEQLGEQPLQLLRPGHRQQHPPAGSLAAQLRGLGQLVDVADPLALKQLMPTSCSGRSVCR